MAQGYFQSQRMAPATFSLFVRSYPPNRNYFVSAGLQDVLEFLEQFQIDSAGIDYLRSRRMFTDDFLDFLKGLKFTGDVWAIPEGRLFFKDEPVMEVTAPIVESQIVETFIINQINFQSLIATKAARCVHAADSRHRRRNEGRPLQLPCRCRGNQQRSSRTALWDTDRRYNRALLCLQLRTRDRCISCIRLQFSRQLDFTDRHV